MQMVLNGIAPTKKEQSGLDKNGCDSGTTRAIWLVRVGTSIGSRLNPMKLPTNTSGDATHNQRKNAEMMVKTRTLLAEP